MDLNADRSKREAKLYMSRFIHVGHQYVSPCQPSHGKIKPPPLVVVAGQHYRTFVQIPTLPIYLPTYLRYRTVPHLTYLGT